MTGHSSPDIAKTRIARTMGKASRVVRPPGSGVPVPGTPGLADSLGRLLQNYDVLEGQLGFNNPQIETNRFSLRRELERMGATFRFGAKVTDLCSSGEGVSLAALCQGILNSRDRFLLPAATPILFNLTIVVGAWAVAREWGNATVVLAGAVIVGGLLQFVVQLPSVWSLQFAVRPLWKAVRSPGVQQVLLLMVPGIAVLGINQLNQFVTNRFASVLGDGAVTAKRVACSRRAWRWKSAMPTTAARLVTATA